jgi:hypothetical protein
MHCTLPPLHAVPLVHCDPSAEHVCGVFPSVGSHRCVLGAQARQPIPGTQTGVEPLHVPHGPASPASPPSPMFVGDEQAASNDANANCAMKTRRDRTMTILASVVPAHRIAHSFEG